MNAPYSIELHSHRLAAWAASTAARTRGLYAFKVKVGTPILEGAGFTQAFSLHSLPAIAEVDQVHRQWRDRVLLAANANGCTFTDGVAAKLINCYLKVRFVCGGHDADPRVSALHPPIDRVLLKKLAKENFGGHRANWLSLHDKAWTKFNSQDYEKTIHLIRASLPDGAPLWAIEEYWQGYQ
jgi:hypothetical protein